MDVIRYYKKPELKKPVLIAGFGGWSNAADIASRSISYLTRKLNAPIFADIRPDLFLNFESSRPMAEIQGGQVASILFQQGRFHFCRVHENGPDLIIFGGVEPHFRWQTYANEFLRLAQEFEVSLLITLGSSYDQVLHYEEKVSAIVSDVTSMNLVREINLPLLEYSAQIGINTLLIYEAETLGLPGIGLWAHAPFYIHGTNYKLCSRVIRIVSELAGFKLDTSELRNAWASLEKQIDELVGKNEKLRQQIREITNMTGNEIVGTKELPPESKIIYIEDFFKKKDEENS